MGKVRGEEIKGWKERKRWGKEGVQRGRGGDSKRWKNEVVGKGWGKKGRTNEGA